MYLNIQNLRNTLNFEIIKNVYIYEISKVIFGISRVLFYYSYYYLIFKESILSIYLRKI